MSPIPNIQQFLEAVKHYQICKNRIEQVEKVLKDKLAPLTSGSKQDGGDDSGSAPGFTEDDIPF